MGGDWGWGDVDAKRLIFHSLIPFNPHPSPPSIMNFSSGFIRQPAALKWVVEEKCNCGIVGQLCIRPSMYSKPLLCIHPSRLLTFPEELQSPRVGYDLDSLLVVLEALIGIVLLQVFSPAPPAPPPTPS